mgnify:CR=1 FL=1
MSLGLIIAELVRSEHLHAKPEQIKALGDGDRPDVRTARRRRALAALRKQERLRDFEAVVLEQNVVDWILGARR